MTDELDLYGVKMNPHFIYLQRINIISFLSTGHTYTIDRLLYVDHYSGRVGKYADNSGELTIYLHVSKWHAA